MSRATSLFALTAIAVAAIGIGGCRVVAKTEPVRNAAFVPSHNQPVCLLAGGLPSEFQYIELGRIKATKRSYGSVDQLTGAMANEARKIGADAIINLQSEQKFKGPLPWRVTAPTGSGIAVKLKPESPKLECGTIGGKSA